MGGEYVFEHAQREVRVLAGGAFERGDGRDECGVEEVPEVRVDEREGGGEEVGGIHAVKDVHEGLAPRAHGVVGEARERAQELAAIDGGVPQLERGLVLLTLKLERGEGERWREGGIQKLGSSC